MKRALLAATLALAACSPPASDRAVDEALDSLASLDSLAMEMSTRGAFCAREFSGPEEHAFVVLCGETLLLEEDSHTAGEVVFHEDARLRVENLPADSLVPGSYELAADTIHDALRALILFQGPSGSPALRLPGRGVLVIGDGPPSEMPFHLSVDVSHADAEIRYEISGFFAFPEPGEKDRNF